MKKLLGILLAGTCLTGSAQATNLHCDATVAADQFVVAMARTAGVAGANQAEQQKLIDEIRPNVQGTDSTTVEELLNRVNCEVTLIATKGGVSLKWRLPYSVFTTDSGEPLVEIYPYSARRIF
jgi:hypothetical protein